MAKEKIEVKASDCEYYEFYADIEEDGSDVYYHYCHNNKNKKAYCKLGFEPGCCSYFKKRKDG